MFKPILFSFGLLLCSQVFSQKPSITWGEEFKMKKGSSDLEIIHTDNSGVYLQETHITGTVHFVFTAAYGRGSSSLVKLDKKFSKIYANDFNTELKGKVFIQFFVLKEKLFIVAYEHLKEEFLFNVYAAEVDKDSGKIAGEWKQLSSVLTDANGDGAYFKINYNADSSKMILVSNMMGKLRTSFSVRQYDEMLNADSDKAILYNEFDPETFQLEDIIYTTTGRIIVVGRLYEYPEGKKKKEKFLSFAGYLIHMYDDKGNLVKEINTNIKGKWLNSSKVVQKADKDLILAAFYSTNKGDETIAGMLVQRIDAYSGDVIYTIDKAIEPSILNASIDTTSDKNDPYKNSKAGKNQLSSTDKIKRDNEVLPAQMKFRNIFYTKDGGIILVAEKTNNYLYTIPSYYGGSSSHTYHIYECNDLLICKINADQNIGWLKVIPKSQEEIKIVGYQKTKNFAFTSYFEPESRPHYAGIGSMQSNGNLYLFFNDNIKNSEVTDSNQKVKRITRFDESSCFMLTVDEVTGKPTRTHFFSNKDIPTAMPRLSSIVNNDIYIIGKNENLLGMSEIAVAKITLQ